MKTHKKLLSLLLVLCMLLSLSIAAYAASGYTMTYYPGTDGTVTNMPENDSGTGGETYTVSSAVPQRAGYVFLGWELGWEEEEPPRYTLTYHVIGDPTYGIPGDTAAPDPVTGIEPGSSVTLAGPLSTAWKTADGNPGPAASYYTVDYLEKGTGQQLALQKHVDLIDKVVGDIIPEKAIDLDGWVLVGDAVQSRAVPEVQGTWRFSGWCSDEACTQQVTELTDINENKDVYGKWSYYPGYDYFTFTFLYDEYKPSIVNYTVRYIDTDTGDLIHDDKFASAYEGETVTEYPCEIENYSPCYDCIMFVVEDGSILLYEYYYSYVPEDC